MRIIGLTGGMASGKSTVSAYLRKKGIPVIDCDEISRHVLDVGESGYYKAVQEFGEGILNEDRTVNRKKLAEIVFSDKILIEKLNAIVHPEVINKTYELLERYRADGYMTAVIDAPLLIEAGMHKIADEVWVVYVSHEIQLKRAIERDGLSRELIDDRLKKQFSLEEKKKYGDYLIDNETTLDELYRRIDEILKKDGIE